jgi:hypothetical protein
MAVKERLGASMKSKSSLGELKESIQIEAKSHLTSPPVQYLDVKI